MSTDAAPDAPPPATSRKKLLVVLVVAAGIVVGGAAGVLMAGPLLAGNGDAPLTAADSAAAAEDAARASADAGPMIVHLVDNMVLNPANSGGSRFLLFSVGFAVSDEATAAAMRARDPEVRDLILRFVGAKDVEQLTDVAQRDSLKVGVRGAMGAIFGDSVMRGVYFPQFVIQ